MNSAEMKKMNKKELYERFRNRKLYEFKFEDALRQWNLPEAYIKEMLEKLGYEEKTR